MKLMILNLPRSFSENDLAKLFKAHGNIRACNIVMDAKTGTSKGFGFVEMAVAHEGMDAIKQLNGFTIQKKKIRVKAAD
jgi:RNA recognition motif-containing protein